MLKPPMSKLLELVAGGVAVCVEGLASGFTGVAVAVWFEALGALLAAVFVDVLTVSSALA